jgi:hypothetical protein
MMDMNSGVSVFIIGLGLGLITALANIIQIYITGMMADKRQTNDWKRQDDVIARADERAAVVSLAARRAADTAQKTLEIATTTHSLVNSQKTADKEATLIALELALDVIGGSMPTEAKIHALRQQISDLRTELTGRAATQETINKEGLWT